MLAVGLLALFVACQPQGAPTAAPFVSGLPPLGEIAGTPAATILPRPTLDQSQEALGQQVYASHCAACHGLNLEGEPEWQTANADGSFRAPPHDATGHTWHHGDAYLLESIRLGGARLPANLGSSHMPPYEATLSETEMTAVLAYFKSTWPEDIRAAQWEMTVRQRP